ncbi:hypothetical protein F0U44_00320 [Nocardioides humilatus]|uniref:Uncharacterized protein n=1 Tax=Nocardioides humilatus TaxID=2607660 RepID=A0A5B1LK38_9ACTN|nr:hypothetical protein [Nocardioides humilatus]KAA1420834.1 hypothetical protein F0U44_00320 [Nocardioides humilatus]
MATARRLPAPFLPAVLLVAGMLVMTACGDDSGGGAVERVTSTVTVTESVTATPPQSRDPRIATAGLALRVETRVRRLGVGEVVDGAILGDEAFCAGGDFRDQHGDSLDEGLVIKTFRCAEGRLTVAFSPQQLSYIQSCPWHVVEGTGRFAGAVGEGWVTAEFPEDSNGGGRETMTGAILLAK